ncbi:MAG: FtsQ-type POTRA domain-containing protein [Candidatus Omnitrophica bacterium]|nr:FtsQ-type POTRA domain-containing protein [Candidatus Omnitrophota bacterium]
MTGFVSRGVDALLYLVQYICRVLILGVSLAGLILLLLDLALKFYRSPDFTVQEITIEGHHRVTGDEIRALAAIPPGTNIWLIRLEELGARLETHPYIRTAAVRRIPPKRIHLSIVEREPVAFFLREEDGGLYGLALDGMVLPPLIPPAGTAEMPPTAEAIQTLLSLPLVETRLPLPAQAGETVQEPLVLRGVAFLDQLRREAPAYYREVVEMEIQRDGNYTLHLRRRIGVMVMHDLDSPDLMRKIETFWRMMEEEDLRAVYVDARFPDKGFAVRGDAAQQERWTRQYRSEKTYLTQTRRLEP